jgi:peptide/nickel transport system substrate-binding protein
LPRTTISPTSWAYDPSVPNPAPDLNKAKALLAQAGNPTLNVETMIVINDPLNQSRAEVLQNQWKAAGINVKISPRETTQLIQDMVARNFNLLVLNSADRGDPDGSTYAIWDTNGTNNRGKCTAPEVDKPAEAARATYDTAQRQKLYGEVEKAELDNALDVILMKSPMEFVSTKGKIGGYVLPGDYYYRLRVVGWGLAAK